MAEILVSTKRYVNGFEDVIDDLVINGTIEVVKQLFWNDLEFDHGLDLEYHDSAWINFDVLNDADFKQVTAAWIEMFERMGFPYRPDGTSF